MESRAAARPSQVAAMGAARDEVALLWEAVQAEGAQNAQVQAVLGELAAALTEANGELRAAVEKHRQKKYLHRPRLSPPPSLRSSSPTLSPACASSASRSFRAPPGSPPPLSVSSPSASSLSCASSRSSEAPQHVSHDEEDPAVRLPRGFYWRLLKQTRREAREKERLRNLFATAVAAPPASSSSSSSGAQAAAREARSGSAATSDESKKRESAVPRAEKKCTRGGRLHIYRGDFLEIYWRSPRRRMEEEGAVTAAGAAPRDASAEARHKEDVEEGGEGRGWRARGSDFGGESRDGGEAKKGVHRRGSERERGRSQGRRRGYAQARACDSERESRRSSATSSTSSPSSPRRRASPSLRLGAQSASRHLQLARRKTSQADRAEETETRRERVEGERRRKEGRKEGGNKKIENGVCSKARHRRGERDTHGGRERSRRDEDRRTEAERQQDAKDEDDPLESLGFSLQSKIREVAQQLHFVGELQQKNKKTHQGLTDAFAAFRTEAVRQRMEHDSKKLVQTLSPLSASSDASSRFASPEATRKDAGRRSNARAASTSPSSAPSRSLSPMGRSRESVSPRRRDLSKRAAAAQRNAAETATQKEDTARRVSSGERHASREARSPAATRNARPSARAARADVSSRRGSETRKERTKEKTSPIESRASGEGSWLPADAPLASLEQFDGMRLPFAGAPTPPRLPFPLLPLNPYSCTRASAFYTPPARRPPPRLLPFPSSLSFSMAGGGGGSPWLQLLPHHLQPSQAAPEVARPCATRVLFYPAAPSRGGGLRDAKGQRSASSSPRGQSSPFCRKAAPFTRLDREIIPEEPDRGGELAALRLLSGLSLPPSAERREDTDSRGEGDASFAHELPRNPQKRQFIQAERHARARTAATPREETGESLFAGEAKASASESETSLEDEGTSREERNAGADAREEPKTGMRPSPERDETEAEEARRPRGRARLQRPERGDAEAGGGSEPELFMAAVQSLFSLLRGRGKDKTRTSSLHQERGAARFTSHAKQRGPKGEQVAAQRSRDAETGTLEHFDASSSPQQRGHTLTARDSSVPEVTSLSQASPLPAPASHVSSKRWDATFAPSAAVSAPLPRASFPLQSETAASLSSLFTPFVSADFSALCARAPASLRVYSAAPRPPSSPLHRPFADVEGLRLRLRELQSRARQRQLEDLLRSQEAKREWRARREAEKIARAQRENDVERRRQVVADASEETCDKPEGPGEAIGGRDADAERNHAQVSLEAAAETSGGKGDRLSDDSQYGVKKESAGDELREARRAGGDAEREAAEGEEGQSGEKTKQDQRSHTSSCGGISPRAPPYVDSDTSASSSGFIHPTLARNPLERQFLSFSSLSSRTYSSAASPSASCFRPPGSSPPASPSLSLAAAAAAFLRSSRGGGEGGTAKRSPWTSSWCEQQARAAKAPGAEEIQGDSDSQRRRAQARPRDAKEAAPESRKRDRKAEGRRGDEAREEEARRTQRASKRKDNTGCGRHARDDKLIRLLVAEEEDATGKDRGARAENNWERLFNLSWLAEEPSQGERGWTGEM
ncbi:hypothetical protein BESB_070700 [Besnoitia besnoiti]|uniref:Uncharacterized protein n=1 Tax=Besnoitia besnoiti TaxID=94643 RepID=A0A2A9M618_BESBE|nr:uncharacterized protein BESB_070700 [Besnoitia besnoiti]PFH33918.1 hypothetical protein BESB_070700 [Besnoitia besnoiti]